MIAELLVRHGLVQFGRFATPDGTQSPVRFELNLLLSYPSVATQIARAIAQRIDVERVERLLCPADAAPLGALVAVETGIPLVYSRGVGEPAVVDLVGAYDVGHPTVLLVNLTSVHLDDLVQRASRFGLTVTQTIGILGAENALCTLDDVIEVWGSRQK